LAPELALGFANVLFAYRQSHRRYLWGTVHVLSRRKTSSAMDEQR